MEREKTHEQKRIAYNDVTSNQLFPLKSLDH